MNDIFLITSVINTGDAPWSYTNTRSFFSSEERFQQTLYTIESIRRLGGAIKIFFVECSLLSDEQEKNISSKVDYFVNLYGDEDGKNACLVTYKKGYGEAVQTKKVVEYIMENNISFRRFFKISGRYYLNNFFNENKYSVDSFTFSKKFPDSNSYATTLYCVPFKFLEVYNSKLREVIEYYKNNTVGLESILAGNLNPKIELEPLGVSGLVAVDGIMYSC
jgi:hypothetical protein